MFHHEATQSSTKNNPELVVIRRASSCGFVVKKVLLLKTFVTILRFSIAPNVLAQPATYQATSTKRMAIRLHVGLGKATIIKELEIRWPASGKIQRWQGLQPDRYYRIAEDSPQPSAIARERFSLTKTSPPTHRH